jgi:hypothetical protein
VSDPQNAELRPSETLEDWLDTVVDLDALLECPDRRLAEWRAATLADIRNPLTSNAE